MIVSDWEEVARELLDVKSRSGDELVCLCPIHGDRSPSLWFNVRKGLWTCYSCGAGGTAKKLFRLLGRDVEDYEPRTSLEKSLAHVSETLKAMEDEIKVRECSCWSVWSRDLPREASSPADLRESSALGYTVFSTSNTSNMTTGSHSGRCSVCSLPLIIPEKSLQKFYLNTSKDLHVYLKSRGISTTSTEVDGKPSRARESFRSTSGLFELGWNPITQAVTLPYRSWRGDLLGVVERRLHGRPKYMYPKKFPRTETMYGSWLLMKKLSELPRLRRDVLPEKWVVLCEGPFDVMKVWQAGLPAVGMWGSQLHEKQAQMLSKLGVRGVVLFTDRDRAGRLAALSAAKKLQARSFSVKNVRYPASYPESHSDPGSLSSVMIRTRVAGASSIYVRGGDVRF